MQGSFLKVSQLQKQSLIQLLTKKIEVVQSAKLLGLTISDNFKRNNHIETIWKPTSTPLYFLRQLKRAKLSPKDLLLFYVTCIRPVAEYARDVFHETQLSLRSLFDRRQNLTDKLFRKIVKDPQDKLYHLQPPINLSEVFRRKGEYFRLHNVEQLDLIKTILLTAILVIYTIKLNYCIIVNNVNSGSFINWTLFILRTLIKYGNTICNTLTFFSRNIATTEA